MKHFTIWTLIWAFTCVSVQAQPDSAALERVLLERAVFYAETSEARQEALWQKARNHKQRGEYDQALRVLSRIQAEPLPPNGLALVAYEQSLVYYLDGRAGSALTAFDRFRQHCDGLPICDSALWLYGLILIDLGEQEAALATLLQWQQAMDLQPDSAALAAILLDARWKSPKTAAVLSTIVPGLGLVYVGRPLEGLLSLALTSGSAAYGVLHILGGLPVTGVVTGGGMLLRFYAGGIRLAQQRAIEENIRRQKKMARDALYEINLLPH
jgi:tetratricopeptide (TPR) repeat protein